MYIKSESTHAHAASSSSSSSASHAHDPATSMPDIDDGAVATKDHPEAIDSDSDRTPLDDAAQDRDTVSQYPPSTTPAATRQLSPTKTAASGSASSSAATRRHTGQSAADVTEKGKSDSRDLKALEDGSFSAPDQAQSILRW